MKTRNDRKPVRLTEQTCSPVVPPPSAAGSAPKSIYAYARRASLAALLAIALCPASVAQDAQDEPDWRANANFGATVNGGNSESFQAHIGLNVVRERKDVSLLRAGAEARYGESRTNGERSTDVENASGFVNGKCDLSARLFAYANGTALHDDLAGLDYRFVLGPGLGVYLVRNDSTRLSVEAGLSYLWEATDEHRDDFTTFRAAERLDWKASETAKLWQAAEYLPKAMDFGDWLLALELGAEAAINTRTALRLVLTGKYDSQPPDGRRKRDLSLVAGASVKI